MTPPTFTFDWTVGDDPFAIPVAVDPRAVFGRARPPVVVAIGAHTYCSTIAIMSGRTFVPLRRSHREAAGVVQGETYAVTLTLDTGPRHVEPPEDLAEALAAAGARATWDTLSYTRKREDAEAVAGAKQAETRTKRIAAVIARRRH